MKMAVIGAGPIGSILGGYLAKGGHEIAFVDILKDHLDAVKAKGLVISGVTEIKAKIAGTYLKAGELKSFKPEIIFICLKAPVVKIIASELRTLNSELQTITWVSFQNGLEVEKDLADIAGGDKVIRVVINYAGNLIAPGEVKMSFFNKPNYIGSFNSRGEGKAKEIAGLMTKANLDTEFVSDIKKYEWEKVILNAALSPLCAITGMTMKQAMDFPGTYRLVEEVLKEGIVVAKALSYDYGEKFFEHCIGYLKNAGHHKTSMHIDIEAKRATEIDFINKKIVDYGQVKGIKTPYNETITNIIKGMEVRNLGK
ncbi:MAG: 2-dehydropantoate 2-reductase [Planctomycetes bacterium]|nr:2-dehydropantoate 2-reductase [Planctomycetota bacterium]